MNPVVPGKFNAASLNTEGGELELRLSDGGNWQLKARASAGEDWRLLCTGHVDGGSPTATGRAMACAPPYRRLGPYERVAVPLCPKHSFSICPFDIMHSR